MRRGSIAASCANAMFQDRWKAGITLRRTASSVRTHVTSFDKWHNARRKDRLVMEYSKTRLIAQEMQKRRVSVRQMVTAVLFIHRQSPRDIRTLANSIASTKQVTAKNSRWPKVRLVVDSYWYNQEFYNDYSRCDIVGTENWSITNKQFIM